MGAHGAASVAWESTTQGAGLWGPFFCGAGAAGVWQPWGAEECALRRGSRALLPACGAGLSPREESWVLVCLRARAFPPPLQRPLVLLPEAPSSSFHRPSPAPRLRPLCRRACSPSACPRNRCHRRLRRCSSPRSRPSTSAPTSRRPPRTPPPPPPCASAWRPLTTRSTTASSPLSLPTHLPVPHSTGAATEARSSCGHRSPL